MNLDSTDTAPHNESRTPGRIQRKRYAFWESKK